MLARLIVTDDLMRWFSSAGAHGCRLEAVPVLAGTFPLEIHGLTIEQPAEPTRDFHDVAAARLWARLVIPDAAEMGKAAAWCVGRIDYAPSLTLVPNPHHAS